MLQVIQIHMWYLLVMGNLEQVQSNCRHWILNGMVKCQKTIQIFCASDSMLLHASVQDFHSDFNSPNKFAEIFEYDATEEPPFVMDVEVFDFEGPFAEATSLGYAEINFLKFTS